MNADSLIFNIVLFVGPNGVGMTITRTFGSAAGAVVTVHALDASG